MPHKGEAETLGSQSKCEIVHESSDSSHSNWQMCAISLDLEVLAMAVFGVADVRYLWMDTPAVFEGMVADFWVWWAGRWPGREVFLFSTCRPRS